MTSTGTPTVLRGFGRALTVSACLLAVGCASTKAGDGTATPGPSGDPAAEAGQPDAPAASHTAADVAFMRSMIHHHAQAVVMARLVPDRAASPAVRRLAARILNSQKTEISLMADWLRDRAEPVPKRAGVAVDSALEEEQGDAPPGGLEPPGGWDAGPQMPGILSDAQMSRLEAARGEEFDRLFLSYMIEHHDGAVVMVDRLVGEPGAAREESVFRLASGIRADQSSEIDRMRTMLRDVLFESDGPR